MNMRADEIAGAMPDLGTAKGSVRNPSPPAHSNTVSKVAGFKIGRSQNAKSSMSGYLYAVMDLEVVETNTDSAPVGTTMAVFFGGLDSKTNNGSLARTNQESMRRLLAAVLGCDPNGAPPPVPVTPDNPNPIQGWSGIAAFLNAYPQTIIGRKVRIVAGSSKGDKPVYPDNMQFSGVA